MVLTLNRSYALDRTIAQRAPEQVLLDTFNQFSAGNYMNMYNGDMYVEMRRELLDSAKKAQQFEDAYGKPPQILERFAVTYDRLVARYNKALENRDEERIQRIAKVSERFKERTLERMKLEEAA